MKKVVVALTLGLLIGSASIGFAYGGQNSPFANLTVDERVEAMKQVHPEISENDLRDFAETRQQMFEQRQAVRGTQQGGRMGMGQGGPMWDNSELTLEERLETMQEMHPEMSADELKALYEERSQFRTERASLREEMQQNRPVDQMGPQGKGGFGKGRMGGNFSN